MDQEWNLLFALRQLKQFMLCAVVWMGLRKAQLVPLITEQLRSTNLLLDQIPIISIIKGIDFLSYNKYTKVSVEVAI